MIAVISDVHGNLPALETVLQDIDSNGLTRIWCLGDTLGYGPYVNECFDLVLNRCEVVIAGNHDLAVRGDLPVQVFGGSAGAGVEYAIEHLTPDRKERLASLSDHFEMPSLQLFHGSSIDHVWDYVRDTRAATRHLNAQTAPVSFVGHSHLQLAFSLAPDSTEATGGLVLPGTTLQFDESKQVFNPGSVGQPRDGDPRAAYAVVTSESVTFLRVPYDITSMRSAVLAAGLPRVIGDRLETGQ